MIAQAIFQCIAIVLAARILWRVRRDFFAAQAMQSLVARGHTDLADIGPFSYAIADQLLIARSK